MFRKAPLLAITIMVIAIMGLGLTAGGVWLAVLGGSIYYLVAGILLLLTSWLLARRRAEALWVYAALLLGTMAWAISEACPSLRAVWLRTSGPRDGRSASC
ncbi:MULTISPECIES: hypothetical protein [Bradyrhizobium]|uniref:hypothetical protein n=1 Tax=Bradyrhizobium TaxID=374 RepID=UPI0004B98EF9|nr:MULTISPECIES: hypothetical protein [unclassified Bradyrhizobium]MDA9420752.1 hypothetical protein [Bradyrhizobium sp. CCBAU 53380]